MDLVLEFAEDRNLPPTLVQRLREYFRETKFMIESQFFQTLIDRMSPTLRGDVAAHCHAFWILKVPFFYAKDKRERLPFITAIASSLVPEAYAPHELICQKGETTDKMFIIRYAGKGTDSSALVGRRSRVASRLL